MLKRVRDADAAAGGGAAAAPAQKARKRGAGTDAGLEATIERVLAASDWRALFLVEAEGGSAAAEVAARAVRNRLVRVVHPDHVPPGQRERATHATQHLNRLWDQARQHFPSSAPAAPSRAAGSSVAAGSLAAAAPAARAALPPPAAPSEEPGGSLELLSREVRAGRMLERPEIATWVGFGATETLGLCRFLPMATNRCISEDVVAQRVGENLTRLRERGSYANFGQISVVAVRQPSSEQVVVEGAAAARFARFYVLDGQHRLRTMEQLRQERPNVPIWFELSVKVVDDKSAANEALLLMQNCYRADPRCFFREDGEAELASRALDLAKLTWPNVFASTGAASFRQAQRPTTRPRLDDGLFYDLLRDTHLLSAARAQGVGWKLLFEQLSAVNDALASIADELEVVAETTLQACTDALGGCFLGLYRRDAKGKTMMERLKRQDIVPPEASCRLDE